MTTADTGPGTATQTGFGLDLGGSLVWRHPERGLAVELHGRGLLTHEDGNFRDRGPPDRDLPDLGVGELFVAPCEQAIEIVVLLLAGEEGMQFEHTCGVRIRFRGT